MNNEEVRMQLDAVDEAKPPQFVSTVEECHECFILLKVCKSAGTGGIKSKFMKTFLVNCLMYLDAF